MIKKKKDKPVHFGVFFYHERDKWRKALTASLRTSLFIGKMCSIRTKGKREERISLSSSMSRSRLFTPLLFTLWAVPLSKFGSMRQKMKSLQSNPNFQTFFSITLSVTRFTLKCICFKKDYKLFLCLKYLIEIFFDKDKAWYQQ